MSIEFGKFVDNLVESKKNPQEKEDEELNESLGHIWNIAKEFDMDPFPINFEIVPAQVMYEIASQGLFNRFSHWTYGREYRQLKTLYDHGIIKIYELILNSNPAQAYLLENNPILENKFVMAHVMGHSDFFKNNYLFEQTRRDMPESALHDSERIQHYSEIHGYLKVERFLDAVLSIDEHIDPYKPYRLSKEEELREWQDTEKRNKKQNYRNNEFDEVVKANKNILEEDIFRFPPQPDKDLLGFIRNHAPYLEDWERDIVDIVRSESLYFYPQRRTKIMNEGWASLGHKLIMRELGYKKLISESDNESWWRMHSGVIKPNPKEINPYFFGMKMFEYIIDYYNGNLTEKEKEWLENQNKTIYPKFEGRFEGDIKDSPGLTKAREIMATNDDQSFIRNYFDKNVAERMNLYLYEQEGSDESGYHYYVSEKDWRLIRDFLVDEMTNCGDPYIVVIDGDYKKHGELYLRHEFEGKELEENYVIKTLPYIFNLWRRPIHLETVVNGSSIVYTCKDNEVKKNTQN